MPSRCCLLDELATHGPTTRWSKPTLAEAEAYCADLARSHYENFTVASLLLPKPLRQHFYNIYAYCRWSDDLADETGNPQLSLELLDWWRQQLEDCYQGSSDHPVFVALRSTIEQFAIPIEPFSNLLVAFRQDQSVVRYATFDDLFAYCQNSANPVGRLVLYLGRSHRAECVRLSDQICTGLQLANFCQDVAGDWQRGRLYLPQASLAAAEVTQAMLDGNRATPELRNVISMEVERAEQFLLTGRPLVDLVSPQLRLDVDLFIRGGLAILQTIRKADYDVWRGRPKVSRGKQLGLLAASWWRSRRSTCKDVNHEHAT